MRPKPGGKLRKLWNLWHWWVGRLLLAAGVGQFFFGVWLGGNSSLYYIVPAALLGLWCIIAFVKVRRRLLAPFFSHGSPWFKA